MRILGKRQYVKNIITAVGFGRQWSAKTSWESVCVRRYAVRTRVAAHVFAIVPAEERGMQRVRVRREEEVGGRKRKLSSPALWLCCKGVQPSPVGPHTRGLQGDRGEGNQPASVTHPPLMLHSIPQTQSQIATGAPHSSSSPHRLLIILPDSPPRCLLIYTLIDVSRFSHPHSITHPPPQHLPFLSSSSIPFFLLSRLFLPSPPPGTFLLCLLSKAPTS